MNLTGPWAAGAFRDKLLPLRERVEVRNRWLRQRLDTVLPELMQREAFDMWIVVAREYNEDPVVMTLLPQPAMSARRRTILVFCLRADGSLERLTLSRYGQSGYYESAWDPDKEEQYACLARIVRERDPRCIGANVSDTFALADGLAHSEHVSMAEALGEPYAGRLCGAERLCIGWLERRIEPELTVYPGIVQVGHAIIAEAFSSRTVQPGITTTDDIAWWMRQRMLELGVRAWFHPTVDIQAAGQRYDVADDARRRRILPGDLLHCDVGFTYLGLSTDQQQNAYVLRRGETDAPNGLCAALAQGNRLQDIHAEVMVVGRTGNQVLSQALGQARSEGLVPSIYSHPLGYHGHAAGPTIGLWDRQGGVPGKGDYSLYNDTCYAIELNVKTAVPEWDGQEVRMSLEEDAMFSGGRMRWLSGRQTRLHLIE